MLTQSYRQGRTFLAVAVLAFAGAGAVLAQAVNGIISGTVTDPSGAAIARHKTLLCPDKIRVPVDAHAALL